MRPGIVVQHARLPERGSPLVRCDITGIIGFIERSRWPKGASAGDHIEIVLRREGDLWSHPDRRLFDAPARIAVRAFFQNGGDTAHLFGVCVDSMRDLHTPVGVTGVLEDLLYRLRTEDEIALLIAPSAAYMSCELNRRTGTVRCEAEPLYEVLLAHCREMANRFLIIDAPAGLHGPPLTRWVQDFRRREIGTRSYGAVYYPWLMNGDEIAPPSGAMAGLYARQELERRPWGVGWPPANVPLRGVTHPEIELDWSEAGELAEEAVNPIVAQAGRGLIPFGSRTLAVGGNFMHVNARRSMNMMLEQLRRDTEWAVFETNNPHLWDVLTRDILLRLGEFAGGGLLTGKRAREDYNVLCNSETNVPELRDAGQVNVHIRMRPVGAVEHILVDLCVGGETQVGGD